MKFAKKKKNTPIWAFILAGVVVVVLVLILVLSGGNASEEPTEPTSQTGEVTPDPTDATTAGEETGETVTTDETPTDPSEETQPTDATESTEATEATEETRQTEPTEPSTGKETEPAQREDHTTMKTPYGTLNFPKEWVGFLRVTVKEGDPYTLTYHADLESGKTQELFTISFGGSQEGALGILTAGGKKVAVHVQSADFQPDSSWSDKEINVVFTMQEALNQLLDALPIEIIDLPPQGDPNLPKEDGENMIIDTPYGELRYPSRWKDYLDLKVNDKNGYSVEFRCKVGGHNPVVLFVVHFGGSKGIPVGSGEDNSGKTVEIRLEVLEANLDSSWSEDDQRIVTAMQEDLNVLLSNLP